MLNIYCIHDFKEKIVLKVVGDNNYHFTTTFSSSNISLELPKGEYTIYLYQKNIFKTKYWWLTIIPVFWFLYGGILLNSFLGYDAKFARIAIKTSILELQQEYNINLQLKKNVINITGNIKREYWQFQAVNIKNKLILDDDNSFNLKTFHLKWIYAQTSMPMILLLGIILITIDLLEQFQTVNLLVIIFMLLLLFERIYRIIKMKSVNEELKFIK